MLIKALFLNVCAAAGEQGLQPHDVPPLPQAVEEGQLLPGVQRSLRPVQEGNPGQVSVVVIVAILLLLLPQSIGNMIWYYTQHLPVAGSAPALTTRAVSAWTGQTRGSSARLVRGAPRRGPSPAGGRRWVAANIFITVQTYFCAGAAARGHARQHLLSHPRHGQLQPQRAARDPDQLCQSVLDRH